MSIILASLLMLLTYMFNHIIVRLIVAGFLAPLFTVLHNFIISLMLASGQLNVSGLHIVIDYYLAHYKRWPSSDNLLVLLLPDL